ncbi:MAG: 50S ribosomal protein L13 [Leptospiraceae bacterium]|nr:50S ribosomal protein L13 [Leptospiraceae bacterium]MDW8306919.1 50S ribosomal protein L13 [Leptospiraceae bacterium]
MDPLYGQKTTFTKKEGWQPRWVILDAEGKTPGRVCTEVVRRLLGKHMPNYQPGITTGECVAIINAAKIKLTGKKLEQKEYKWHTGHPGGLKSRTLKEVLAQDPRKVFYRTLKGMLPKTYQAHHLMRHVRVFPGPEHNLHAQHPVKVELV